MLKSYYKKGVVEAGCDEAGRGCLAGPVFAAAVILPEDFTHPFLTDSKKLSPARRCQAREAIEKSAISYAIAQVDNHMIDRINILKASIKAMHMAIEKLRPEPDFLIIDGNKFYPYEKVPFQCIVKGDGLYFSIAAASILAKTYRDEYMQQLHQQHPEYRWNRNKGYPTKEHRTAIQKFGITTHHRITFIHHEKQLKMPLFQGD